MREVDGDNTAAGALDVLDVGGCDVGRLRGEIVRRNEVNLAREKRTDLDAFGPEYGWVRMPITGASLAAATAKMAHSRTAMRAIGGMEIGSMHHVLE